MVCAIRSSSDFSLDTSLVLIFMISIISSKVIVSSSSSNLTSLINEIILSIDNSLIFLIINSVTLATSRTPLSATTLAIISILSDGVYLRRYLILLHLSCIYSETIFRLLHVMITSFLAVAWIPSKNSNIWLVFQFFSTSSNITHTGTLNSLKKSFNFLAG